MNSSFKKLKKIFRYIRIYGLSHTLFKVAGRTNLSLSSFVKKSTVRDVAVIGCGQFSFSNIGYFVSREYGDRFKWCVDVSPEAMKKFGATYRVPNSSTTIEALLKDSDINQVYIASNHSSHAPYAIRALEANLNVYVEKPVAVNRQQLKELVSAVNKHEGNIFVGYNRPFSKAIMMFKSAVSVTDGGFSLNCFVSGHVLDGDHWYRDPKEGTRICGNAGHWIDLFVHLVSLRSTPEKYSISVLSADKSNLDDDFTLSITTDKNDIFSLMLTARTEPFEGINESIDIQHNDTICKIDDFRKIQIWQGEKYRSKSFWPKDVGHKASVLQPFSDSSRPWSEVLHSSILMIKIVEMLQENREHDVLFLSEQYEEYEEKFVDTGI